MATGARDLLEIAAEYMEAKAASDMSHGGGLPVHDLDEIVARFDEALTGYIAERRG